MPGIRVVVISTQTLQKDLNVCTMKHRMVKQTSLITDLIRPIFNALRAYVLLNYL